MHRTIILVALFAAAPIVVACDKSGSDAQSRATQAQEQANREIGRANAQASEAQEQADKKIAAAEADFIKLRESYRASAWGNLDTIDKRIADLEAKASSGDRPDLRTALAAIHARRDVYANDVRVIDSTSAANFDATKARIDKEWADLKAAVDKAS